MNTVLKRVEWKAKDSDGAFEELQEWKVNSWWVELNESGIKCNMLELQSLLYSDFCAPFNPFTDYFTSLKQWDGTDYIERLAERVKTTKPALWFRCFRIWLVALVACATKAGAVNHLTLILRSDKQGIGKTTWFQRLLPPQLKNYLYSGIPNFDSRDTLIAMFQNILINIDEIDAMSRRESNRFNEMITKPSIQARRAYGRNIETYERHASFCGSTNSRHILTDLSGSRRFLCFEVEEIDYISPIDYENIYSQAVALIENGFRYWLDSKDIEEINLMNEDYRLRSPEEEFFHLYFRKPEKGDPDFACIHMSAAEIMRKISGRTGMQITQSVTVKIGRVLRKNSFLSRKSDGIYKYCVIERSDSEIEKARREKGKDSDTQGNIAFGD